MTLFAGINSSTFLFTVKSEVVNVALYDELEPCKLDKTQFFCVKLANDKPLTFSLAVICIVTVETSTPAEPFKLTSLLPIVLQRPPVEVGRPVEEGPPVEVRLLCRAC